MFDKELFYALCNQYGVELSDKYDKPMLKTDDGIREPDLLYTPSKKSTRKIQARQPHKQFRKSFELCNTRLDLF